MRRTAALALLLSACGIPTEKDGLIRATRIRNGAVCAAYDDLRRRGVPIDTTDAETRELHRAAMEVCDQVEAEGGEGTGL